MNLLDHDYSLKYSTCLFCHEVWNQIKFALNCIEITAFKFEKDDPIWNYLVKRSFLSDLIVEWFVVPKSVAKHLE